MKKLDIETLRTVSGGFCRLGGKAHGGKGHGDTGYGGKKS